MDSAMAVKMQSLNETPMVHGFAADNNNKVYWWETQKLWSYNHNLMGKSL